MQPFWNGDGSCDENNQHFVKPISNRIVFRSIQANTCYQKFVEIPFTPAVQLKHGKSCDWCIKMDAKCLKALNMTENSTNIILSETRNICNIVWCSMSVMPFVFIHKWLEITRENLFFNENEYCLNWEFFWRPWTVMYIVNYYYYYYFIQCFNLTMEHFINSSITIHIYLQFRNQSYHIYCWQKNSLLRIFVHLFMLMCYLRENARSICIWMKTNFYISSIIINKFVWRVQKVAIEKAIVIFIFFVSACWCVCRGKFDWKH